MRKFLMAAGLLALVACGDKKPDATPPAAPTMAPDTGAKKDTSMSAMSGMKDTTKKDSGMAAPKKP